MNKHNLGFGLCLTLLFLAPEVPLRGLGLSTSSLNLGLFGLAIWLLLSAPRFGLGALYRSGYNFSIVMFAYYALLVSMASFSKVGILHAAQFFSYAILCGCLVPAYLEYRRDERRLSEVYSIFAFVGAVYLMGLIVSYFTGPIYSHQLGSTMRHFEDLKVLRAAGFSAGVNTAGGVAAVFAAFALLVWYRFRYGPQLAFLAVLGLLATLSRSALVSFAVAMAALALIHFLRLLLVRGARRSRLPRIVPWLALLSLLLGTGVAMNGDGRDMVTRNVYYGLQLTDADDQAATNVRLEFWQRGVDHWLAKPPLQQAIGAGFLQSTSRSFGGAYVTYHNVYLQILNDFGLIGLLLFAAVLVAIIARLAVALFATGGSDTMRFAFAGLVILAVHNLSEVFLYHGSYLFLLVFLVSLGHLELRAPAPWRGRRPVHGPRPVSRTPTSPRLRHGDAR